MNTSKMDRLKVEFLAPLKWLKGQWKGFGKGEFPTMDVFEYESLIRVDFLEDSFSDEPLIRMEETAWIFENGAKKFKHWETGFIKPAENSRIQFYNAHNTGRIEITYGHFKNLDLEKNSFELVLKSEFIRNDKGLKTAYDSFRTILFENDILNYNLDMSTEEVPCRSHHLSASLKRTTELFRF